MLILLGFMSVLESVVVFLLSSGIEPMVAIGRAALGLLKSKTGSTLAKAVSAAFVVLFASNISNVFRVQKRIAKMGASQADQSIIRSQLLEITLIGSDLPSVRIKILAQVSLEHAAPLIRLEGLNVP
ncbi:hypothetical protein CY35_03G007600 [Sphagnum magellanicum]|nr:hypothetical protein CY35_03G007600 [Sphagnum magellanicum]